MRSSSSVVLMMMVLYSLCVLGATKTNAAVVNGSYPAVEICKRQECPSYIVLESNPAYEIRSYKGAKWITTNTIVTAKTYNQGVEQGFIPLFNYIRGGNEGKVMLNMTAPVLTNIDLGKSLFQVYLLLPKNFQGKPANIPKGGRIRSVILPRKTYAAVRRFGGRIKDANLLSESAALRKVISTSARWRAAAASTTYSAADYNPPFQAKDRVNELIFWFDI